MSHVILQADNEKEISGLSIYMGDQISREDETVSNIQFRLAGQVDKVRGGEPQKVELFGMGTHLRFVFEKADERSGQVSLRTVRIWGQQIDFHEGIVNHEMPALNMLTSEDIDRLILEQGMSLQRGAFDNLAVDEETAITIREVEQYMDELLNGNDYAKLEEIKTDLNVLKADLGPRIA